LTFFKLHGFALSGKGAARRELSHESVGWSLLMVYGIGKMQQVEWRAFGRKRFL